MRVPYQVKRVLSALPYDAWGLGRENDELAQTIRCFINTRRWQRFSPITRPFIKFGLRALWLLWCPCRTYFLLRTLSQQMTLRDWRRAAWQCILYAQRPAQVISPELPLAGMKNQDLGELRVNHWLMLWELLGNDSSRALAQDKLEFANRLQRRGLPVPATFAECYKGDVINLNDMPWPSEGGLFIKPRHGSRAEGACSVMRIAEDQYLINGSCLMNEKTLITKLNRSAEKDSLLVQTFLQPMKSLTDLSPQSPTELRITTIHLRDGEPHIFACYMKVQPPGAHTATALTGALVIPISPDSGFMEYGLRLNEPSQRYSVIPWNGSQVSGRVVPDYASIKSMVIAASRELPGLPCIGWDVLLTAEGPVILEANCGLSWRLIHLRHALLGERGHLPDLVSEWIKHVQ